MDSSIQIRFSNPDEEEICALVKRIFDKFVAPDYPQDGIQEFYGFANPTAMKARDGKEQILLVAEEVNVICGILEMRNINHISLLFVEKQGRGIARSLLSFAVQECSKRDSAVKQITVNSSPYAQVIYYKLGFRPTGPSQTLNGITFTPMALVVPANPK